MRKTLCALVMALTLTLVGNAAAAHAASNAAERGRVFHPTKKVTLKQISSTRVKITNRTPYCVALTVVVRQSSGGITSETMRAGRTHQKQRIWGRGKVVRVKVYRPGC